MKSVSPTSDCSRSITLSTPTIASTVNGCSRLILMPSILLRELHLPLFSLETRRAAGDFAAFGFSLVDEANYTNMLTMLELAHIPLRSAERDNSHPIILAGGPAVFNPEPIAPFVDCFFVGDAEIGLPEILTILHDHRQASREEKLELLCRSVESVYIPRFYDDRQQPLTDFAPKEIQARIVPELKAEYYPKEPIVPIVETAHNHLGVEIMRGCPQGCRYCMAGPIYKPVRKRPIPDIMHQVDQQLRHSGYTDVTLLSLSSSDYPEIEQLATSLARRLEPQRISLGLPSLRPGTISPELLGGHDQGARRLPDHRPRSRHRAPSAIASQRFPRCRHL